MLKCTYMLQEILNINNKLLTTGLVMVKIYLFLFN